MKKSLLVKKMLVCKRMQMRYLLQLIAKSASITKITRTTHHAKNPEEPFQ